MRIQQAVRISILIAFCASGAMAQTATARIVSAANKFLSTLDDKQKKSVLFAYDDEQQRKRWSNLPVAMVPRAGLKMGDLNPAQKSAAMDLVAYAFSARGVEKIRQIMDGAKTTVFQYIQDKRGWAGSFQRRLRLPVDIAVTAKRVGQLHLSGRSSLRREKSRASEGTVREYFSVLQAPGMIRSVPDH